MDNHMDNNPNGNRPDNNKGPGKPDPNKNHQSILAFLVCLLVTLVCFAMFTNMLKDSSSEITYDKFIEMVNDGDVKEVSLQSNTPDDHTETSVIRIFRRCLLYQSDGVSR